jgi:hypothetical protein
MFGVPSCDEVLKISCLKFKLRDKLSLSACRGNVGLITDPGQAQDLSLSMFHVSNCSNIVLFSYKLQNLVFYGP